MGKNIWGWQGTRTNEGWPGLKLPIWNYHSSMHFLNENGQWYKKKEERKQRFQCMEISVQSQIQWCSLRRILTFGWERKVGCSDRKRSSLPGLSRFDEFHWPQPIVVCLKGFVFVVLFCNPTTHNIYRFILDLPIWNLCLLLYRLASLVFLGRSIVPRSALIRMFGLEYVNIFACLSISTLSCCCFPLGRRKGIGLELEVPKKKTVGFCRICFGLGCGRSVWDWEMQLRLKVVTNIPME